MDAWIQLDKLELRKKGGKEERKGRKERERGKGKKDEEGKRKAFSCIMALIISVIKWHVM